MPRGGSDTGGATAATARPDRDALPAVTRWARAPQVAALRAFQAWAAARGVNAATRADLRRLIDRFALDPQAPDLELAMRQARRDLARQGLPHAAEPR